MNESLSLYEKLHFLHRCFRYKFRTEKQQISKMLSYDLKNKTAFDVGGNHGIYTYFLSRAVGPHGALHVFEPQPELVLEIEKISEWLNFNFIKLNSFALSDSPAKKTLSRKNIGDGSATLETGAISPNDENIVIQTTTIDDYCLENLVESMDYLKIDVEGHELPVIQGGLKTIKKLKPIIQIELRVHEPSCDKVISTLTDLGYRGVMLCDGQEIPISLYKTVPSKYFGLLGHRDFIFESV